MLGTAKGVFLVPILSMSGGINLRIAIAPDIRDEWRDASALPCLLVRPIIRRFASFEAVAERGLLH
jgi:hypothetical protein